VIAPGSFQEGRIGQLEAGAGMSAGCWQMRPSGILLNLEIKVDSIAFHQHLNESIKFARRGLVGERAPATREPMYWD
jgi:hypothetical protein